MLASLLDYHVYIWLTLIFIWMSYRYRKAEKQSRLCYYYIVLLPQFWFIFTTHASLEYLHFRHLLTLPSDPAEKLSANLAKYDLLSQELTLDFGFCFLLFCIAAWAKQPPRTAAVLSEKAH